MEEEKSEFALRLERLEKALATLEEALGEPLSSIVRDATIQRFEYTFELAWKLFRKLARVEGNEVNSPRQAIRAAYEAGVIDDIDLWFEMLEDRNRTSHIYNEGMAIQVYASAQRFPGLLRPTLTIIRRKHET